MNADEALDEIAARLKDALPPWTTGPAPAAELIKGADRDDGSAAWAWTTPAGHWSISVHARWLLPGGGPRLSVYGPGGSWAFQGPSEVDDTLALLRLLGAIDPAQGAA